MRNGYRERSLLTPLGWIGFELPRIRCVCGGSVQWSLDGLIRPYQRISDETDAQIQRWYRLGQSLRQLQGELSHTYIGPLSLQTLLTRIHQLAPTLQVSEVPPLLQIDAIWVTQLLPTGRTFQDQRGRQRAVKRRVKRPIFIALGVWPETDQALVLDWMLGASENGEEWGRFLSRLEAAGVRGDQGLKLIIHDGGSGLCSALQIVHFDAAHQRCLFHKIRNIANAIHLPTGLSRRQRTRQRKAILKHFRAIWQAKRLRTALRRYLRVVRRFRTSQPDAVATLRRDFRHTIAFYRFRSLYDARHLRTTSRLERLNRSLRTRLRPACALHSDQGLVAMISHQIHAFNAT
jgi:transposase-like protein